MRSHISFLFLPLLIFILSACANQTPTSISTQQDTTTKTSPPAEQTATHPPHTLPTRQAPNTPLVPSQTPEDNPEQLTHYKFEATLNYAQHHLVVDEQIRYTNRSSEPISDLLLIVEPARYPGAFTLIELTWQDGQPILDYTRELGLIRIPMNEALQPGDKTGLSISYELNLPSPGPSYYGRPVHFGYSIRQTNLVDWYPFIPPYEPGQGWVAHKPGAFGEHLVYEMSDFDVNIRLSDSNPDLLIAACAPGVLDDDWWRYHFEGARNFSWSISDQYVLSTSTVDSVVVMSYYFPLDSKAGEAVLQTTSESLAVYNDLFGPYSHQTLTVVEADFLDGMEYDGLYFLSKGFYNLYSGGLDDYLTAIAAHETAHQWWYSSIGNDQALEPWLDESLSTYSERLYYEKIHPQGLDWWWTYRINYYNPRGWVDGSIYNPQGYLAYRDAVYLNGALFLEDLRNIIGDESFFDFLEDYSHEFDQQIATTNDFFALLGKYSQEDISPLLDEYFQMR
ncbi:MAG TPA: M1 family metallopeptidase [Anaerolineales bacterium]|nr:M1 family metallopeptidase [Anaerolineales bacterium]